MQGQWTLDPKARLALHIWDGEAVVHHFCSNHTHRLAEPAGAVIVMLRESPSLSAQAIATGVDIDEAELLPVLQALSDLGLLRLC